MVCVLAGLISIALAQPTVTIVDNPRSRLLTWESGSGARPFVLLHGYGSRPENWLPFADTIRPGSIRRF